MTQSAHLSSIHSLHQLPNQKDLFLVGNRSPFIYVISVRGNVVSTLQTDNELTALSTSARGEYIYASDSQSRISCLNFKSTKVVARIKATDADILALVHHPFANIIAVLSDDGLVNLWH